MRSLRDHGVDRVFCVPGESYLHVLDALRDSGIDTVVARQEGAAAMMAEADGKMCSRAGVCFVTRGPGATNASSGVHVAQQDSTPMVLFVGQVASGMLGRDAFQEVDYDRFFGGMAKAVYQLAHNDDVTELVAEAFSVAQSGRPGPVVVALPEDLQGVDDGGSWSNRVVSDPPATPDAADVKAIRDLLAKAERPIVIAGGSGWGSTGVEHLQRFAETWNVPVSVVFRRQQLFDHDHSHYAGDCGIGVNPSLRRRVEDADLVIALGTRFSEIPSQSYTLLERPQSGQRLVHVHTTDTDRFAHADIAVRSHPEGVLTALNDEMAPAVDFRNGYVGSTRTDFEAWTSQPPANPGPVQMGEVITHLRSVLQDDAIITNGAGNYSSWVHRYFRFRRFGTQLAPTSGSMGYGLPAAVAAKVRFPDRQVVCFAGDGCFQMTGMEFGTAVQIGANVVVVVVDNGMYGTIRMHQERRFPHRTHATDIVNPDFAALARAFGGAAFTIERTDDFAPALDAALAGDVPALLHVRLDPEAITPDTTLSELSAQ